MISKTGHNILTALLDRIATCIPDALLISDDKIKEWEQPAFNVLLSLKIIKEASPLKIIDCPGCEEACLMPLEVISWKNFKSSRIFIACDKRDDISRVPINGNSLKNWHIDVEQLIKILADILETNIIPEGIHPNHSYYLGIITINRKQRTTIFICNCNEIKTFIQSGKFDQYPNPFFLVTGKLQNFQDMKQYQLISLRYILEISENHLSIDMNSLKQLLSFRKKIRHDVIPFSVPEGTEWEHVIISFANDHTVQIKIDKLIEHRSFDEMGFSDTRKKDSEPTELWKFFRLLAKLSGEITFQDSIETFDEPEKVKKWISQIRKKLRTVFLDIPDDPFLSYNKAKGYKTRFTLNTLPSFMYKVR